jgi:excisionase family DNA binding protein
MRKAAAETGPLLYTAAELSRILQLGRNKTYELIASGEIPVIRFGRAIRIPRGALEKWIEQKAKATTK